MMPLSLLLLLILLNEEALGLSLYPRDEKNDNSLSHLDPIIRPYLPERFVFVPLGHWKLEDLEYMCDGHISLGCSMVKISPAASSSFNDGKTVVAPMKWKYDKKVLWTWSFAGPETAVDRERAKVFMMTDLDQIRMAEKACDNDLYRRCRGIVVMDGTAKNFSLDKFHSSQYMPIVFILLKERYAHLTIKFDQCIISDDNFAVYHLQERMLVTKMDLAWSISCMRNIRKKVFRAYYKFDSIEHRKSIKARGNIKGQLKLSHFRLWYILSDKFGFGIDIRVPYPKMNATRWDGGIPYRPGFRNMHHILNGMSDLDIFYFNLALRLKINIHADVNPYFSARRYNLWAGFIEMACPLPKRIPSYYNLIYILSPVSWGAVGLGLIVTCFGLVLVDQVYRSLPNMATKKWKWHHISISTFSILFAEDYPSGWGGGLARTLLTEVWKWAAMFIVFIFLCNLRSHLIGGNFERPINSMKELIESDKVLYVHQNFRMIKESDKFVEQGRFFVTNGTARTYDPTRFVKRDGCIMEGNVNIETWEYWNQQRERRSYFHRFPYNQRVVHFYWFLLRSNPYMEALDGMVRRAEEAGMMKRLWHWVRVFKPLERESLEPLGLEHFIFPMVGISVGLAIAIAAFAAEKLLARAAGGGTRERWS